MNREYNSRVSSKNSALLIKNLKNTTGDYFFCCTLYTFLMFSPSLNFFTCQTGAWAGLYT